MKKIIYILILSLNFSACEEVIPLDLETSKPRLVIDATITFSKETISVNQFIKLTLTTSFYSTSIPPATGANVKITDQNNITYNFTEENNTGIYRNNSFNPKLNDVYALVINYNNEIYTASETLMPVTPILRVEQKNNGGFSKDETEIKAFYKDPLNIKNYYFFEFINTETRTLSIDVYDDDFTDGNEIFAFYSSEDLKPGNELIIKSYGISERFYEYMFLLLQQSNDNSGGPFQTQPATLRGNCINQTNPENYPLGYFRASEVASFKYIIQ